MADIKTANLTGTECKVPINGYSCWIRNDGSAKVYGSDKPGIIPGKDRVICINGGCWAPVDITDGNIYLSGEGTVQLYGTATDELPFGSGSDIITTSSVLNTLYSLQGNVPFSKIEICGEVANSAVTIKLCGKNLITYPYRQKSGTINGVTFTVNDNGTITANGTATANTNFYLCFDKQLYYPFGKYTMSGCPMGGSLSTYRMEAYSYNDENKIVFSEKDIGDGAVFELKKDLYFGIRIGIYSGVVCNNLTFRPQLECGAEATSYEPYHGNTVTVTPDCVPYTVPNDIRQQDGVNNIMVSAGTVQVTGVRRDAALKRVWDKLDELTTAIIVSNGD